MQSTFIIYSFRQKKEKIMIINKFKALASNFEGDFYFDHTMRTLYATDASAYREMPLAVAMPRGENDIKKLIEFARENRTSLIPRTAGTSLAGQVVGNGIVVDVSKYFTKIIEVNKEENWVRLQPGVVRDELNFFLSAHKLYFGPETSTANRAMVGGMVGNNSCGSNSVIYGSTRDHLLEVKAILSDGTESTFSSISKADFFDKCQLDQPYENLSLESGIYRNIYELLANPVNREQISREFPKKSINRRNTGYAIDLLMETSPFIDEAEDFNFCRLLAGSEGTLAFITEIKLHVDPTPPAHKCLVCAHFTSIGESLKANLVALQHNPSASELMDQYIMECTKANIEHRQNRFFIKGEPGAILVVELSRHSQDEMQKDAEALIADFQKHGFGYHYPIVYGDDIKKVWNLRKAGLGLLSNMPGDAKPVPVIEDTAVDVNDLPDYIAEFNLILKKHDLFCVHYAHAGSGELHLRPILNLKTHEGNKLFRIILEEIARLVKKYNGSLSGEHGDGRLRGEFIHDMIGDHNYELLKKVKYAWDPTNIYNPGKIVDTPPMDLNLRYFAGQKTPDFDTKFDFSQNHGVLRAAEQCNGSGDCRKSELTGGVMCPSYMATRNEKDTTRARANILREMLTNSAKRNRFDHKEIHEVMDLCLSCKGCKSECPSNVDVAKLKSEFLYQYQKSNGVSFRTRLIANMARANKFAAVIPGFYNFIMTNEATSSLIKSIAGFAQDRSMPLLYKTTLSKWFKKNKSRLHQHLPKDARQVLLFNDEFTNYLDTLIGIKAVELLTRLGYKVDIPAHDESGRTYISKGLLKEAEILAKKNIELLSPLVSPSAPIIGIEPSAILTLRDEYLDLVNPAQKVDAQKLADNAYTFEEFLAREKDAGYINSSYFTSNKLNIKLHGHCYQKSLSSLTPSKKILQLPENYKVQLIPSGCCGMAGSFGYEKEHYQISMQIGELVLLPAVRKSSAKEVIAAAGTSCRHQIKDGTGKIAMHPVEVLYDALK